MLKTEDAHCSSVGAKTPSPPHPSSVLPVLWLAGTLNFPVGLFFRLDQLRVAAANPMQQGCDESSLKSHLQWLQEGATAAGDPEE